jgi:N-methylhydantoinase B
MSTSTSKAQTVDPVTVEIIRNGLLAVTEEMKTNLTRTAYNLIIYEALDFTVGLFTTNGDTVSIGLGLPMFIRGMSETVKAKIKRYGLSEIKPGDILVTNDAYTTGSHLNHFTFTMPVFHQGELVAFTCCMAHWLDVGGTLGQVTTDIYSEGIQIPIVKYRREGVVNQELVDIIAMNVRLSERAMGTSCADYRRYHRRAPVLGTRGALRQGRGLGVNRADHGPFRSGCACKHALDPRRNL